MKRSPAPSETEFKIFKAFSLPKSSVSLSKYARYIISPLSPLSGTFIEKLVAIVFKSIIPISGGTAERNSNAVIPVQPLNAPCPTFRTVSDKYMSVKDEQSLKAFSPISSRFSYFPGCQFADTARDLHPS